MSILHEVNQGILVITLNRPDKLNALNEEILSALEVLFMDAKTNPAIKAVLLTGAGKAFCAGADINRLQHCDAETGYQFSLRGQHVFNLLEGLGAAGKPSIAAVNGFALGGGCELAMAATLRIGSSVAKIGQPEVKLGVIPGYGGTQRLTRLVGHGRALDLCLTGRFISAETALEWGLLSEVTNPETLMEKSYAVLHTILSMSSLAIASIVETVYRGSDLSLQDALHLEAVHFAKVCASPEKEQRIKQFLSR